VTDTRNELDPGAAPAKTGFATTGFGRRKFLAGTGLAAAAAVVLAACGSDDDDAATTDTTGGGTTETTAAAGVDDATIAGVAAGLEVLAVSTYQSALDAATANKLGAVPPAVASYVTTALGHHKAHLAVWNGVLKAAGRPEVTTPNATLKPTVDTAFAAAKDVTAVAELALLLEGIAAQTYLKAIPLLKDKTAIRKAGEIQIIDQQHQAILLYALGRYPVPEVFQKTDQAAF
jgi:hypothetical protein